MRIRRVRRVLIHYKAACNAGFSAFEEPSNVSNEYLRRISINSTVMVGKPVIRETRIPVELLVRMVAQGIPYEEILDEYPGLQIEDIQAALFYAAAIVAHEQVFPLLQPEAA